MEKEALAGEILRGRDVRGVEGEFSSSTMGCVVLDVDLLAPNSSAHLCWAYEAYGCAAGLERKACLESPYLVHLRLCRLRHRGLGSGYLPH